MQKQKNETTLRKQSEWGTSPLPSSGERDGAVERVIKNLVEYDKRGRRLVEEAEEERGSVLAHMDDYKKELAKQYREREREKVEQFRQQAQMEKEEALSAARARHEEALGRLKANYQKNSARWVAEIVDRCIGG